MHTHTPTVCSHLYEWTAQAILSFCRVIQFGIKKKRGGGGDIKKPNKPKKKKRWSTIVPVWREFAAWRLKETTQTPKTFLFYSKLATDWKHNRGQYNIGDLTKKKLCPITHGLNRWLLQFSYHWLQLEMQKRQPKDLTLYFAFVLNSIKTLAYTLLTPTPVVSTKCQTSNHTR